MPLGFSSQLFGSWNEMHFFRRLNPSIMGSLWFEQTFQIVEITWNTAVKFGIIYSSSVSPKTHTKVPSGALLCWFFSVNTKGNATFGVCASLCACLTLCGCQKVFLGIFCRTLEWLKLEKLLDQRVQTLTQHVFVDVVLILRKNKMEFNVFQHSLCSPTLPDLVVFRTFTPLWINKPKNPLKYCTIKFVAATNDAFRHETCAVLLEINRVY